MIDETYWEAVLAKDGSADGAFVYAVREDNSLSGYRWGRERKHQLLQQEGSQVMA